MDFAQQPRWEAICGQCLRNRSAYIMYLRYGGYRYRCEDEVVRKVRVGAILRECGECFVISASSV